MSSGIPSSIQPAKKPRIGIVGFGAFGRLVADSLVGHFSIVAFDPLICESEVPAPPGVAYDGLTSVAACPIVVLAVPVSAMKQTVGDIRDHLRPGALVLDVGSVKVVTSDIMREGLPDHVDVVATHPLFGPQSARGGLKGLKIAICPIRGNRHRRVAAFLRKALGLQICLTTPEAHDREAAMVQGITHLIAKVLLQMEPLPSRMTTVSFDLIAQAIDMIRNDAPEVFDAIELDNPYAADVRRRFFDIANSLNAELDPASGHVGVDTRRWKRSNTKGTTSGTAKTTLTQYSPFP